jgi:hypothetical protein
MSEKKDEIIKKIYFDPSGFGSIQNTYKEARQKDKTISLDYVKEWFKRNTEQKKKPHGQNSFVADQPFQEIQVDLFFITVKDLPNQTMRVGLMMVDIFTKEMHVIPLKTKQEKDVLEGVKQGLAKYDKKPFLIYSDDEGSLNSSSMKQYLDSQGIKLHTTRGHAPVAERQIRTFKDMLFKRVEASNNDNIQWTDYIYPIELTYNKKNKHSTTGMTPHEAKQDKNRLDVKVNTELKAKKNRRYPPLEVDDNVKIMRKKKNFEKERTSHWNNTVYKVKEIVESLGQSTYKLEGVPKTYMRHELLKL